MQLYVAFEDPKLRSEKCCRPILIARPESLLTMSEIESLLKLGQTMGLKDEALAKCVTSDNERHAQERKEEREHRLKQRQLAKRTTWN